MSIHPYDVSLTVLGIALLGTALLPRLLAHRPLSFPMIYVAAGALIFSIPLGLVKPDPIAYGVAAERLTELGVIIALMSAGLRIDRPPGWQRWMSTWRLLLITMPLTIVLAALLSWWAVGLAPVAAMLVGAVIAPTDPVLAGDVQVGPPGNRDETEVRFALTSEAGLNDGLAFPFTNAAIATAVAGLAPERWLLDWLAVDVVYKVVAGFAIGILLGRAMARVVFSLPIDSKLGKAMEGSVVLALTLLVYGATELAGGYGFIAVFVASLAIRDYERSHEYREALHEFATETEHVLMTVILLLFGGAIATGLLAPLTWAAMVTGLLLVLVVRPAVGWIALYGMEHVAPRKRWAISFLGIRGIGSFYYISHALNQADFPQVAEVWALVGFTVLVSIVVHGISASPIMQWLEADDDEAPTGSVEDQD